MTDLCSHLLTLLKKQFAGDESLIDQIALLSDRVCGEKIYRDTVLTPQQIRGMELVLEELRGMFSFYPGRRDGLPHLISLLEVIGRTPQIEQMEIYGRREWKEVVKLRGPVETVLIRECAKCKTTYPRMGTSGFLDLTDLLCGQCGDVIFKSLYEEKKETTCPCGGLAKVGCPSCGFLQGRTVDEMSPYRYFAEHRFYREQS